jgi:hypothetical protein
MSDSFTQIIWAKFDYEETGSYKVLFGKSGFSVYGLIVEWYGGNLILGDFSILAQNNDFFVFRRNGMGFYPSLLGWNFIAHSYDSSAAGFNHYLYIGYNNKLYIYRTATTGTIVDYEDPIQIGDGRFSMSIGRTALYNRTLSVDEISKIYYKTKKWNFITFIEYYMF